MSFEVKKRVDEKGRVIGRPRYMFHCEGKSMTKQSFKEDCDINNILKKYRKNGKLPDMIKENPRYGDFSSVPEYQEACNIVIKANEQFDNLDSNLRNRFANSPSKFLEFMNNPENKEEIYKLGLAIKPSANGAEVINKPDEKVNITGEEKSPVE